jgi:alpha-L-fucosidase
MNKYYLVIAGLFFSFIIFAQEGVVITSEEKRDFARGVVDSMVGWLSNPSFEEFEVPYNENSIINIWNGTADIEYDGSEARDGKRSLRITGMDASVTYAKLIKVPKNTVYEFTFWMKQKDLEGNGKTGLLVSGNTDLFISFQSRDQNYNDEEWHEIKHYLNTGEATELRIELAFEMWGGGGTGTVYYDDMSLKELARDVEYYEVNQDRKIFPGTILDADFSSNEWFGTMKGGYPRKFRPDVESLRQYECPEWFRDAKFGIYMHWGVYSVPEMGAWFARNMYNEGSKEYRYMTERFGNLQEYGYKDLIPLWKAENFDPEALVTMFKEAGARYFTPVAVHHDNFDLWDSRYNKWNAVNMGPEKDIIGMFRNATLKHGLRWGVTTHLARSYSWFNTNKLSDKHGLFDGNNPGYQDYYQQDNGEIGHTATIDPDPKWRFEWACRIMDLIDQYNPDLLYFDGSIPFRGEDEGKTGMNVLSYYYNKNAQRHNGKNEGVMCIKHSSNGYNIDGIATLDFERGYAPDILEDPWQTDDALGPWAYVKGAEYMSVNQVIDKLVNIVSKNGNYLLNVGPKADGTLDDETISILEGIGKWLNVNGEAIYATRPWKQAEDGIVRFTQSKDKSVLYAIALENPDNGKLNIAALASGKHELNTVKMIGYSGKLKWKQTNEGLEIIMPKSLPCDHAWVFVII